MDIQIIPHSLSGTVTPPPSKSQTHRLLELLQDRLEELEGVTSLL